MNKAVFFVALILFSTTILNAKSANSTPSYSTTTTDLSTPQIVYTDIDFISEKVETYLLLAHKWSNEAIFLNLKIDGTFEAKIDGQQLIYGSWSISSNQENLTLCNDPTDEDVFYWEYTLSEISYHSIQIIDKEGSELALNLYQEKGL